MAETVLVNAATVTAGATSAVVAYQVDESPFVDFRIECDKSYSVRFYVANVDFDAVVEAAILTGNTSTGRAATTGEGDVFAAVDSGSYDYIACVVTNDGATSATVTIAADYDATVVEEAATALFTVAEARAFADGGTTPLSSVTDYPPALLIACEAAVRELFTMATGVAFIPTTVTAEQLDGNPTNVLHVSCKNPAKESPRRPLTVSAATIDGVALTVGELAAIKAHPDGRLVRTDGATWDTTTAYRDLAVTVTYVHGWAAVPSEVKQAALMLAVRLLVGSDVPLNATSYSDGSATFTLTYAGPPPHWTGHAWIDAVLDGYRENRVVIA